MRFDDSVWREAIRGFSGRSLQIATSARAQTEQRGVALADLLPCEALGPDGTQLAGCGGKNGVRHATRMPEEFRREAVTLS